MNYVSKTMVMVINQMCVGITGGYNAGAILRAGQSLSFVDRIFVNEFFGTPIYQTVYDQAAAYMFYIIKNHAFMDGNKRTGLLSAITFLRWNGIEFAPLDEDPVFDFVIGVASGPNDPDSEIPKIAAWLRSLTTVGTPQDG